MLTERIILEGGDAILTRQPHQSIQSDLYELIVITLWMQGDDLFARSVREQHELFIPQAYVEQFLNDLVVCDRNALEAGVLIRGRLQAQQWQQWLQSMPSEEID